jgi:hypothetical protein
MCGGRRTMWKMDTERIDFTDVADSPTDLWTTALCVFSQCDVDTMICEVVSIGSKDKWSLYVTAPHTSVAYWSSFTRRDMIDLLPFFRSRRQFDKVATPHTHRTSELPFPKRNLKMDHKHSEAGSELQQFSLRGQGLLSFWLEILCQISKSRENSSAASDGWDYLHLWLYRIATHASVH